MSTQKAAFQAIKKTFLTALVLQHFDPKKEFIVKIATSDDVSAAVLSQQDHKSILQPGAFKSCWHFLAERNYEIYDKKLLAIVQAIEEWRPELESSSQSINFISDHNDLKYFMSSKWLSRRQARWSKFLSCFNFKINYKPGSQYKSIALTKQSQDLLGEFWSPPGLHGAGCA